MKKKLNKFLQEMLKVASSFLGKLQLFSSTMTSLDTVGSAKYPKKIYETHPPAAPPVVTHIV